MPLQPTSTLQGKTATGPVALPVALLVAAFVAFWTLRAVVSTYNLDTFGDMVENLPGASAGSSATTSIRPSSPG